MKRVLVLLGVFCVTPNAFPAEPNTERGISVFDANPRCMERTVDPADPACTLRSEGAPRQYYPPPVTTPVLPNPPIMPPSPPVPREAAPSGTRQAG